MTEISLELRLRIAAAAAKAAGQGKPGGNPAMAERIAAAKAGTLAASPESLSRAAEADQIAQDRITLSENSMLTNTLNKFVQGIPFVGEFTDEAEGMIASALGRDGAAQTERTRAKRDAMDREYPKTSLAAQVAGGVAGSAPLAAAGGASAAGWVAQGASRATQALRAGALAGAVGAVEGATAGAGRNDQDRARGALAGGAVGGTLGAILGAAAPMIGDGVASIAKRIKRLDVAAIADEFGLSRPAARVVKGYLMNDDLAAAATALARQGDDAVLANAGPATRQALDTAMSTGGEALAIGRRRVDEIATAAGQRFKTQLDEILGAPGGIRAAARDIAQRTSGARQAAYARAYETAIDYADEAGRKIEEVFSRIPRDTLNRAIKEANEAMQAAGVRNRQIMASIAPDGKVTFRQMPNVQQLDEIKKALGSVASAEVDQFGRPTAAGLRASKLATELRDAIADAVPTYRTALKLGGDKIAEDRALAVGRGLLSARTTVEDVLDVMRGASQEARAAARRGLRENIDAIMGRARSTLADMESGAFDFATGQNAAKEALDAMRALTAPDNVKKARFVLGRDATRLFQELQRASDALVLRAAVARNSATAIRQAGQEQMAAEVAPGLVRRTAGNLGNPLEAARELTQAAVGTDAGSISAAQRAYYAEIADALTRIRGPEAQRALAAVQNALAGQPIKDAEAALIGRLVSGGILLPAYQAGRQSQSPQ